MCLILLAHRASPRFPLVVAANRDEDHDRPTLPADFWPDAPDVLGGRDALHGGSWLALHRNGRLAAVTNLRFARTRSRSRGTLVREFVMSSVSPLEYVSSVSGDYAGFHLIAADRESVAHYTNAPGGEARAWSAGVDGVSNGPPESRWPKVERGVAYVSDALSRLEDADALADDLLRFLANTEGASNEERIFVTGEQYGTRSSTVIVASAGELVFVEQSWLRGGVRDGEPRKYRV